MKNDTFKQVVIGVTALAVFFIVLAIEGAISTGIITIAVTGGVAVNGALLYYLGRGYTGCHQERISGNIRMEIGCQ